MVFTYVLDPTITTFMISELHETSLCIDEVQAVADSVCWLEEQMRRNRFKRWITFALSSTAGSPCQELQLLNYSKETKGEKTF